MNEHYKPMTEKGIYDPFTVTLSEAAELCSGAITDESLDIDTLVLASAAYVCLCTGDPNGKDIDLFNQISPILHPDIVVADYSAHHARIIGSKIMERLSDSIDDRRTVYSDIEFVMRIIMIPLFDSEEELFRQLTNDTLNCEVRQDVNRFMDETHEMMYLDDPFFALAVCIYTSLRFNAVRAEAVSVLNQKFPYIALAPENAFDEIQDAINLVDAVLEHPLTKTKRSYIVMWHIIRALVEYYNALSESGWKYLMSYDLDDLIKAMNTPDNVKFSPDIFTENEEV